MLKKSLFCVLFGLAVISTGVQAAESRSVSCRITASYLSSTAPYSKVVFLPEDPSQAIEFEATRGEDLANRPQYSGTQTVKLEQDYEVELTVSEFFGGAHLDTTLMKRNADGTVTVIGSATNSAKLRNDKDAMLETDVEHPAVETALRNYKIKTGEDISRVAVFKKGLIQGSLLSNVGIACKISK